MTDLQFPFEIESSLGTRWIYVSNDNGRAYYTDGGSEPAGNPCLDMVISIVNRDSLWPAGSCAYFGPLRTQEPDHDHVR